MRFRVGDIAVIRHLDDIEPDYRGRECTVLSGLIHVPGLTGARYRIELQGMERYRVYASPHVLKRLPPPNTKLASWRECPWRPASHKFESDAARAHPGTPLAIQRAQREADTAAVRSRTGRSGRRSLFSWRNDED